MRAALLSLGRDHGRPGTVLAPVGIVVHSTASADGTPRPDATARRIRDYFEGGAGGRKASAHVALDWNESLVLVPCFPGACERAWHAGPTANSRLIGVEWCEEDDPEKFAASRARLVKVVRLLCVLWEWPLDGERIWSHARVSRTWRETDHTDPEPYLARFLWSWDRLLREVAAP